MKKVLMKRTVPGVREGKLHPEKFIAGMEYEIDNSLFEQFEILGVVTIVSEKNVIETVAKKQTLKKSEVKRNAKRK